MSHTKTGTTPVLTCDISNQLLHTDLSNKLTSCLQVDIDQHNAEHVVSAIATRKKDKLTPENLMKLWHIGFAAAKRTLKATTHQCLCSLDDICRRF